MIDKLEYSDVLYVISGYRNFNDIVKVIVEKQNEIIDVLNDIAAESDKLLED